MRNHVRVLAWIYIVFCGLTLGAGLLLCMALSVDADYAQRNTLFVVAALYVMLAVILLLPGLVGGIGLLKEQAWARILLLIVSVELALLFPIGTPLGAYGIWTLWHPQTRELLNNPSPVPATTITRDWSPQLNLVGIMAAVAAGFFLMLRIGFYVNHDNEPAVLNNPALTVFAALVLLAALIIGAIRVFSSLQRAGQEAHGRREAREMANAYAQERHRRIAELAADPHRAAYAQRVERGEVWSDEQIAYHQNAGRTATCGHLQPMEQALRNAGIEVRLDREGVVSTTCRIDLPALQQYFDLTPPVRYAEFYTAERTERDHPIAHLTCDEHRSWIITLHPDAAGARTAPIFPQRNG